MQGETDNERATRRRRKDARPVEIAEAAFAAFIEQGFAATRVDDVARRAGVAKGTVYLYYPDKEALFLAAVRSRVQPLVGEIGAMVERFPGTTRELLTRLITTVHGQMIGGDVGRIMRIVIAEGERFPALASLYHRESLSKGRALFEAILARGIARGEVRDGPATRTAIVLAGPAVLGAMWSLTFAHEEPLDPAGFLEAHLDLVFNGILVERDDGVERS